MGVAPSSLSLGKSPMPLGVQEASPFPTVKSTAEMLESWTSSYQRLETEIFVRAKEVREGPPNHADCFLNALPIVTNSNQQLTVWAFTSSARYHQRVQGHARKTDFDLRSWFLVTRHANCMTGSRWEEQEERKKPRVWALQLCGHFLLLNSKLLCPEYPRTTPKALLKSLVLCVFNYSLITNILNQL